jgi:hypothetical protein
VALQVGALDLVPERLVHLEEVLDRTERDAGVVDEDVDGAESLDAAVERVLHLVARRDVAADGERGVAKLLRRRDGARLVDVGDDDRRALGDVAPRDGPADALPCAGHQRNLPLESSQDRLHSLPRADLALRSRTYRQRAARDVV